MWRDLWTYRKRAVVLAASVLVAMLAVAVVLAIALGGKGGRPSARATPSSSVTGASGNPSPAASATGYNHTPWNAVPSQQPATSTPYPAIKAEYRTQPDLFARAFGTELLTREYHHSHREQLLAWTQASSAPLTIVQVPLSDADRAKALLTSLTTEGWDTGEIGTPVPAEGQWLALGANQAYTTVSGVKVQTVPNFPPADTTFTEPTLDRLYTATVTLHTMVSGKPVVTRTSVAFEVVMTDHLGRFGAAEVQHYVVRDLP
ncbi:MAG: hypothetical protein ACRDNS_21880 [Trebonia sp.]